MSDKPVLLEYASLYEKGLEYLPVLFQRDMQEDYRNFVYPNQYGEHISKNAIDDNGHLYTLLNDFLVDNSTENIFPNMSYFLTLPVIGSDDISLKIMKTPKSDDIFIDIYKYTRLSGKFDILGLFKFRLKEVSETKNTEYEIAYSLKTNPLTSKENVTIFDGLVLCKGFISFIEQHDKFSIKKIYGWEIDKDLINADPDSAFNSHMFALNYSNLKEDYIKMINKNIPPSDFYPILVRSVPRKIYDDLLSFIFTNGIVDSKRMNVTQAMLYKRNYQLQNSDINIDIEVAVKYKEIYSISLSVSSEDSSEIRVSLMFRKNIFSPNMCDIGIKMDKNNGKESLTLKGINFINYMFFIMSFYDGKINIENSIFQDSFDVVETSTAQEKNITDLPVINKEKRFLN